MPQPAHPNVTDYHRPLQDVFGFAGFRPGQEDVVRRLLEGRAVLAIFPTGAGKSLCYQLPALLLPGLSVVISPLIALMKDQVDFLKSRRIAAARLDSTLDADAARAILQDVSAGKVKLLYVAPERLANERFQQTLRRTKVAQVAVDEAHCISEWGHNFRPDYLKLAQLTRELGVRRVLALTATATPAVQEDIARNFGIEPDCVVHTGFYRPNLNLQLTPCDGSTKLELLKARLAARPKASTIVYVTLQKTAETVADDLAANAFQARAYHAGMEPQERADVQNWFMTNPEAIVVATIAFGMGIDKSNIQAIYHYNLPKSLENYTQEIGRAGRDGSPSVCELLATGNDRLVLENFIYGDTPSPEAITGVVAEIFRRPTRFDLSLPELSSRYDIRVLVLQTLLTYLELEGLVRPTGQFYGSYRFQPRKPSKDILARFDKARAAFLGRVFREVTRDGKWFVLDPAAAAERLKEPRERLVAALCYLEGQGDLILQPSRRRHGFARKDLSARAREDLCRRLTERFFERERRDLDRLHEVLRYVDHAGCATGYLLNYFGDASVEKCGHCNHCEGAKPGPLPPEPEHELGPTAVQMIQGLRADGHTALATPRQLARFLCGISSPAASRAGLTRQPTFAALADRPFMQVMQWLESVW